MENGKKMKIEIEAEVLLAKILVAAALVKG